MLKKLIKYDFIWVNRNMVIYFAITAILSILTRIASNNTGSVMGDIIYSILRGVTIAAFASTIINSAVRIWERFRKNIYRDESYLTHTLPVGKNTLYNSKILSALCSIAISLAVIIVCFFVAFWNEDIYNYFRSVFKNGDMTFIIIGFLVTAILEIIYAVFVGIFGLIVGHRANNNRVVMSVVVGIVLYYLLQCILLGIIYAIGMFDDSVKAMFGDTSNVAIDFSTYRTLIIIADSIYLVFAAALYFSGKKLFSKGVNIE